MPPEVGSGVDELCCPMLTKSFIDTCQTLLDRFNVELASDLEPGLQADRHAG